MNYGDETARGNFTWFPDVMAPNAAEMTEPQTTGQLVERITEDYIEIAYLSVIIVFGIILNTGVFVQLTRQSRAPTASTSFLAGPYQLSSFNLFKMHLCLTDFAIVLVHALGKIVWLITIEWKMGGYYGCKAYQFLSAFTYYANSNVVVSIGLDRLKVVYTSHIQGATSVRRVRWMLMISWTLAALCALPQLYVWKTFYVETDFLQCTTIWQIAQHRDELSEMLQLTLIMYEMCHQVVVFWIPFLTLLSSYLMIVVKVLHYTLHPVSYGSQHRLRSSSLRGTSSNERETKLLSSFVDAGVPTDYYQFAGVAPSTTEMSELPASSSSGSGIAFIIPRETGKSRFAFRLPWFKRVRNHCDCLLAGQDFSEKVIEKRKMVCCGSVRSCCLNAETGSLNFRAIGIRKAHTSSPVWRRQLRSRIFITSLAIVTTHFLLWLPYNSINTLKFIHKPTHEWLTSKGANLLEDLIVLNSVLNPILYAYEPR